METNQLVAALLAISIGGGILYYARLVLAQESQKNQWPRTTGEIISSKINKIESGGEDGPLYYPDVRYRYHVNFTEYESTVITTSSPPTIGTQGYAKAMVNKYQPNNKVEVFYNPKNVNEAVLDKNASSSGMLLLLFLGIPSLGCGLLLLAGFLYQLFSR